jgi:hypothetical protein
VVDQHTGAGDALEGSAGQANGPGVYSRHRAPSFGKQAKIQANSFSIPQKQKKKSAMRKIWGEILDKVRGE